MEADEDEDAELAKSASVDRRVIAMLTPQEKTSLKRNVHKQGTKQKSRKQQLIEEEEEEELSASQARTALGLRRAQQGERPKSKAAAAPSTQNMTYHPFEDASPEAAGKAESKLTMKKKLYLLRNSPK